MHCRPEAADAFYVKVHFTNPMGLSWVPRAQIQHQQSTKPKCAAIEFRSLGNAFLQRWQWQKYTTCNLQRLNFTPLVKCIMVLFRTREVLGTKLRSSWEGTEQNWVIIWSNWYRVHLSSPKSTRTNPSQPKSTQVNLSQPKSTQVNPSQPESSRVNPSQP